jgi:hypothetical protein
MNQRERLTVEDLEKIRELKDKAIKAHDYKIAFDLRQAEKALAKRLNTTWTDSLLDNIEKQQG